MTLSVGFLLNKPSRLAPTAVNLTFHHWRATTNNIVLVCSRSVTGLEQQHGMMQNGRIKPAESGWTHTELHCGCLSDVWLPLVSKGHLSHTRVTTSFPRRSFIPAAFHTVSILLQFNISQACQPGSPNFPLLYLECDIYRALTPSPLRSENALPP